MSKKVFLLSVAIASLSLLLTQCSTTKVDPYKNTLSADSIIMNGGLNNSGSRNQAQSLYADALNNINKNDPNFVLVTSHANFGLAMIGTWNALSTISGLLSSNLLGSLSGGSVTASCTPIDLTPYQSLLGPVIDSMISPIVTHLQAVTPFTGFSFTISSANLVVFSDLGTLISSLKGQGLSIDMSGAYDLGEVDGMLSLFETLQGGVKVLFAYNGVLNAIVNLLMGLTQTGCTMPNPLLDPNFGTLSSGGAQMLSDAQVLLANGANNLSNSMSFIMARKGDNSTHGFIYYVDANSNGKYDPGEAWGSDILGQVIVVVLKLLPSISPSIGSNSTIKGLINIISSLSQKQAAQAVSQILFVNGGLSIPLSASLTLTIPAISKLIYLTDLQSVANVLNASETDTNGQHPIDIVPAIPVLIPRLLPVLTPLLSSLGGGSSTLGPLIGMLPTLVAVMFDSTGDAYTSLPVLPSIDLGAFFNNPPTDLKVFAPLSYQASTPFVDKYGTGIYVAPEPFADGFVHVPDPSYNNGAGYWTSTASLVNGTCDNCVGDPTSPNYAGEWYSYTAAKGKWVAGDPIVNIYGDGMYHKAGDIIEQYDEEQAFPLQTQPFTGLSFSGITMTAWSDTGTNRVADNLQLGYNSITNPNPYGNDITCNTLSALPPLAPGLVADIPWPIPNIPPAIGETVCGEKNGIPDMWNGSLFSLLYAGAYIDAAPLGIPLSLGVVLPLGPLMGSASTPFFPRYHYWPGSTFADAPKLITLNVTATTFVQLALTLLGGSNPTMATLLPLLLPLNSLDSIAIAMPNDAYMFFPDPTFGGLLTVGQFNWCSKYQNYIGIPYNGSALCDAIAYSTTNMNNAQMNQYVNIVNLLINVLTGKVNLSSLGL